MKFYLSFLMLFAAAPAFGQGYVGNGGLVAFVQGRPVLADLLINETYRAPYIGATADPAFKVPPSLSSLGVDRELFARKLTDINLLREDLGDFVAATLAQYDWRLTDNELPSTLPNDGSDWLSGAARLFQIAVRNDNQILINRTLWNQLDAANKVALLVHEAFYSLTNPLQNQAASGAQQWAGTARFLTAACFQKTQTSPTTARVWHDLPSLLSIPEVSISLAELRRPAILSFDFAASTLGSSCKPLASMSESVTSRPTVTEAGFAARLCEKLRRETCSVVVYPRARLKSYRVALQLYEVSKDQPDGPGMQLNTVIKFNDSTATSVDPFPNSQGSFLFTDVRSCERQVELDAEATANY